MSAMLTLMCDECFSESPLRHHELDELRRMAATEGWSHDAGEAADFCPTHTLARRHRPAAPPRAGQHTEVTHAGAVQDAR